MKNYPYSVALWTRPSLVHGSVLLHLSTYSDGNGRCLDLIGFSSIGHIVVNGWTDADVIEIVGPILPADVWTHIVTTFSSTNGFQLFINGTFYNSSSTFTYAGIGNVTILTLGSGLQEVPYNGSNGCQWKSITPSVYNGSIDEFRVYSRELNSNDIYSLANPLFN